MLLATPAGGNGSHNEWPVCSTLSARGARTFLLRLANISGQCSAELLPGLDAALDMPRRANAGILRRLYGHC